MKSTIIFYLFALNFWACNGQNTKPYSKVTGKENQVNCNSPDADVECMFVNLPKNINEVINISGEGKIQNLAINGKVLNAKTNNPYSGILLYAYHTDEKGIYSKSGYESGVQKWHGKHHGWCKTDAEGRYEIRTLKPAPYPSGGIPAHIHMYVKLNSGKVFYINDFVFSDDPLVDENYLKNMENTYNPKGIDNGVVDLKLKEGVYFGKRDILLVE